MRMHPKTPLQRIHDDWPYLTPFQRKMILAKVYWMALSTIIVDWLRYLRPINLLVPIMVAQIFLFVCFAWLPSIDSFINILVGNIIIAGVAMLPSTLVRHPYFVGQ